MLAPRISSKLSLGPLSSCLANLCILKLLVDSGSSITSLGIISPPPGKPTGVVYNANNLPNHACLTGPHSCRATLPQPTTIALESCVPPACAHPTSTDLCKHLSVLHICQLLIFHASCKPCQSHFTPVASCVTVLPLARCALPNVSSYSVNSLAVLLILFIHFLLEASASWLRLGPAHTESATSELLHHHGFSFYCHFSLHACVVR